MFSKLHANYGWNMMNANNEFNMTRSQDVNRGNIYLIAILLIQCVGFSAHVIAAGNESHGATQPLQQAPVSLMKRSERIEFEIEKRQRAALQSEDPAAKNYQQGFQDGYNKAVLDLVKAKLMPTDPSGATSLAGMGATTATSGTENHDSLFWIEKSVMSLNSQQWDLAIEAANEAMKADTRHISPYINRAWAYAEKGFIQRAISDANQAILINPNNSLAYNNRGYAHELGGQLIDAKADYQQACNLDFQPACNYSVKLAGLIASDISKQIAMLVPQSYEKFQDKDWTAVESLTTRIINLDPRNTVAYVNRAGARTELGQLDNALDDSNRAIQLNPGFGLAYNNQAYVYELMGKRKQATASYAKACELGVTQSCADQRRLADNR